MARPQILLTRLKFYGLAVDKRRLDRDSGLRWKQSFYKNLCGRAYRKLFEAYPGLHVRADRYGRAEFMDSFGRYIEERHRPTLFDRGSFEFVDGKNDVAVQLADLVAGVLARTVDPVKSQQGREQLLTLLRGNALGLDLWPASLGSFAIAAPAKGEVDERIARLAITTAGAYLEANEDSRDSDIRCRVAALEVLLLEAQFGSGESLPTGYVVDVLKSRGLTVKDETWLRRNVIAPLRDAGVIITSSSAGYKLPSSRADLEAFVKHADAVCVPMLSRALRACDAVKLATHGEVDVLEQPFASNVNKLVNALEDARRAAVARGSEKEASSSEEE